MPVDPMVRQEYTMSSSLMCFASYMPCASKTADDKRAARDFEVALFTKLVYRVRVLGLWSDTFVEAPPLRVCTQPKPSACMAHAANG